MAFGYNNYQQPNNMYYPMDNLAQMRSQQQPTGLIWVQGEAAAKSYLVAAGSTVALWDSENPCIYLKSVDVSGMPTMRILDYSERVATPPAAKQNYVTQEEFGKLAAQVAALIPKEVNDNG